MFLGPNRSVKVLITVALKYIEYDSIPISEKWRAYFDKETKGNAHLINNPSNYFFDLCNFNIHTKNIENHWRRAKR
ncbi:hypothetical protein HZS_5388 [Henneguya salminicola]|nr:hypothetical protein HZS_5388 [Henneguya salminicola]